MSNRLATIRRASGDSLSAVASSLTVPVYYTLPKHQADILGWMVDTAREAPRHLHEWRYLDGKLAGANAELDVLGADITDLEKTELVRVTSRNYISGTSYVLSPRAAKYIDAWRAQRNGLPEIEPSGWDAVDQAVRALRKRLASATTANDFKAVGHECVTVLEALGRAAFDPARHLPDSETEPSNNDAKRKLELFTRAVAPGDRFAHVRKIINAAYSQGHQTKHRDAPDQLDAEVGADAVVLLVSIIRRFANADQAA
jgi:hypothetical protein